QNLERRQKCCEERGLLLISKPLQCRGQPGVETKREGSATKCLYRRTAVVCGQADRGQFSRQFALPIVPQSFSGRTRKFLPLPLHKVRVTLLQRNKVCSVFFRISLVQFSNFIQQQRKR